jgi:hypothetical protein
MPPSLITSYKTLGINKSTAPRKKVIETSRGIDNKNFEEGELTSNIIQFLENQEISNTNDLDTSLKYNFSQNFKKNKTFKSLFILFIDILLVGVYFTLLGYFFAFILNDYLTKPLTLKKDDGSYNPVQTRYRVFSELILECLAVIVSIYISVQIGLRLPFLVKKAPLFHRDYRVFSGGIILVYTLMSLQDRMIEKARYVFGNKKSEMNENIEQLIDCAKDVDGVAPTWTDFRDCIADIT